MRTFGQNGKNPPKIRLEKIVKLTEFCLQEFHELFSMKRQRKLLEYPENLKIREITSNELIFGWF